MLDDALPFVMPEQAVADGQKVIQVDCRPKEQRRGGDIVSLCELAQVYPSSLYPALMTVLMQAACSPSFSRSRLMWVSTARLSPS